MSDISAPLDPSGSSTPIPGLPRAAGSTPPPNGTPTAAPQQPKSKRGSTNIRFNVGKRTVKEYPLTESDIESLGMTKGGSTFFFAAGSLLVGFVVQHAEIKSWEAFLTSVISPASAFAIGAAIVCYVGGAYLWYMNGSTIRRIKSEMTFDS